MSLAGLYDNVSDETRAYKYQVRKHFRVNGKVRPIGQTLTDL